MTSGATPVLVADDSTVVRRLVSARLREAGYRVAEASDGVAALQALHLGALDYISKTPERAGRSCAIAFTEAADGPGLPPTADETLPGRHAGRC